MASMPDIRGTLRTTLFTLLLTSLLGGCDGGLFGTDDGGGSDAPPLSPGPVSTDAAPGTDVPLPAPGAEGAPESAEVPTDMGSDSVSNAVTPEVPPGSVGATATDIPAESLELPIRFDNTQIATTRNDALMTVVNPRDSELQLVTRGLNEAQTQALVLPSGAASDHLSLPVGTTTIEVFDGAAADGGSFSLELNLGTGTLTTIVARDDDGRIEALPLVSRSGSSDPTLASVRLLQTVDLGDPEATATLSLDSRGPGGGGVDTQFAGLSFNSPDSGYQEVPAGDYTLTDEGDRFAPQAVSLAGGLAYTMIIRARSGEVLQLEVDSDLDVR